MKKISIVALAMGLTFGSAFAGQMGHNNKMHIAPSVMNVTDITMLNDDSRVVVQGYLVQNMGKQSYAQRYSN